MPGEEIAKTESFDDRMMRKIRESIGELMTEEDLKKIIEKGMEQAFFKGHETRNQWGNVENRYPPLALRAVEEHARKVVDAAVEKYFKENPQAIEQMVQKYLDDGIAQVVLGAISRVFGPALTQFGAEVDRRFQAIREGRPF